MKLIKMIWNQEFVQILYKVERFAFCSMPVATRPSSTVSFDILWTLKPKVWGK